MHVLLPLACNLATGMTSDLKNQAHARRMELMHSRTCDCDPRMFSLDPVWDKTTGRDAVLICTHDTSVPIAARVARANPQDRLPNGPACACFTDPIVTVADPIVTTMQATSRAA